jgi:Holliday junction resolvasome RuvABC ATP-dependent DNA helicase subunit
MAANLARGGACDLPMAQEALRLSGLFPSGLSLSQMKVLEFLAGMPKRQAGIGSLSAYVGLATRDMLDETAWLVRERYIVVTPNGRQLTDAGAAALKEATA